MARRPASGPPEEPDALAQTQASGPTSGVMKAARPDSQTQDRQPEDRQPEDHDPVDEEPDQDALAQTHLSASSSELPPTVEPERGRIFALGARLGEYYEVRGLIGAGGMGQVFEGYDSGLDRHIAIKALWPDVSAPPLQNEARALAAFQHPALPTVFAYGVHEGTEYIVMERVIGMTLHQHMHRRAKAGTSFSVERVVELVESIAEGLSVMHHAGLVHGDIKPENLMLMPNNRLVIMDLGLVFSALDPGAIGRIHGTPKYMALEALRGDVHAGSAHLLDIHALGAVAHELLTGAVPRQASSLVELIDAHPEPTPDVSAMRDDVPPRLADLVRDMISSNAEERPQNAEHVLQRLKTLEAPEQAQEADAHLRLMIVDDDKAIANVLGFYAIRTLGPVDIITAEDGEKAIEQLHDGPAPDIMLLDLHMPNMNGIELLMYMQGARLAPDCQIIAVSAGAQPGDRALLRQLGIKHFIDKGQRLGERLGSALADVCGQSSHKLTIPPPGA